MINQDRFVKTLLDLLAIPSPCGFTDEVVRYIAGYLTRLAIPYDLTRRGTVRAKISGAHSGKQQARAIVSHADTIGAMVSQIQNNGRLRVSPIGFWSARFAEGSRVTLFSEKGTFRGTLLPAVRWGVTRDQGIADTPIDWNNIELRLDETVETSAAVRDLGVDIGDFVALDSTPEVLHNGFVVGRHIDNKAGVAIVLETLAQFVESGQALAEDLYVLFTITETIGTGTGSAILPDVSELVTVDFAAVDDGGRGDHATVNIASADASGPFDYHLTQHLMKIAEAAKVPYQTTVLTAHHNDAASALAAGHDVRTAVLAYRGDASHSIERTHIASLANTVALLFHYATNKPTFTEDTELTTVDAFSHQISKENLPPPAQPVPDINDVLDQQATRLVGRDDN